MADAARLYGMLQASAARNAHHNQSLNGDLPAYASAHRTPRADPEFVSTGSIPCAILEALIHTSHYGPHSKQREPLRADCKIGLSQVLDTLNSTVPREAALIIPCNQVNQKNHGFVEATKGTLDVPSDINQHQHIPNSLDHSIPNSIMTGRFPVLSTSNLPAASAEEQAATASPARGTAMLNSIFKSVRVPEFRHKWMFWAEKGQQTTPKDKSTQSEEYASRPKPLGEQIISVKEFYQHFNNIPVESLKLRDSIHLFHLGVKPVWEDPRNSRGGAWYFKIPKDVAAQFWHEMCLLAVGDVLQGAVETKRESFNDDICGISYSVRWNAVQIAIWNRDASNEAGREKLLATILEKLSDELQPKKEDSYWYKAHKEHKGFIEQ